METNAPAQQRDTRVPFMATPDEIAQIDDYRYSSRIPSRSEALRRLLRMGLEAHAGRHVSDNEGGGFLVMDRETIDTIFGDRPGQAKPDDKRSEGLA